MNAVTQFEDLSNDLFLEIFEYLHALDIFMAFSLLNSRISVILSLPRLHVVITKLHCCHQIKFLSSHLTHHAHQVISVTLHDELRDFSSVISFFFDRHTFINLQSCIFCCICPSSKFHTIIQKLGNLNKLVSFRILQPKNISLTDEIKQDLSKIMLMHQSSNLRSIELVFRYDYPRFITNLAVNWTVRLLDMMFDDSMAAYSFYRILPILRNYHVLRVLRISISNDNNSNTQQTMLPTLPAIYENNPPISFSIKKFDLTIKTLYDFHSLNFILRCMPTLRQFGITIISSLSMSQFWREIFNGNIWQRLITNSTIQLDVFDIFLHLNHSNFIPDMDVVVQSFDFFARKYDDWYLAIHRSQHNLATDERQIILHGFRRSKKVQCYYLRGMQMVLGTLEAHSTSIFDTQQYLFYSNVVDLHVNIPINRNIVNTFPSGYLFKNIAHLIVKIDSSMLKFWEIIFDLFHIRCYAAKNDQKYRADQLGNLVDLPTITKVEFQPKNDITQLHFVEEVLLASSSVIQLKIGNAIIFSPELSDNLSLIPVFHRVQLLYLLSEHVGFPIKYASKIGERFPSLVHLELEVHSIDISKPLVNILLDDLRQLVHLKIHFHENIFMGDGTCFINYVIERRRRAFPFNVYNPNEISVKVHGQIMDIYLSGCSICAHEKYFV